MDLVIAREESHGIRRGCGRQLDQQRVLSGWPLGGLPAIRATQQPDLLASLPSNGDGICGAGGRRCASSLVVAGRKGTVLCSRTELSGKYERHPAAHREIRQPRALASI